jgi:hypothetical protein
MNRKLIVSISIILIALLGELILWNKVALVSMLLILLAFVKHTIYPIKKELLWYVLICVNGAIIEMILVNFGHGWSYLNPDFFGIPIWIPFFWGVIGTNIIVIYDELIKSG